jgi:hypothetical protein
MTHLTQRNVLGGLSPQQHSCENLISHISVLPVKSSYRRTKSIAVPQRNFQRHFRLCGVPCHKMIMLSVKALSLNQPSSMYRARDAVSIISLGLYEQQTLHQIYFCFYKMDTVFMI